MGFSIYYRSTRPVDSAEADAICQAAEDASEGRTWLSCEPVVFYPTDDGHLSGGSKPNFQPDPDDVESASATELPDGTVLDLIDVLGQISREHNIDWELSHDVDPALGFIRAGVCDAKALQQLEAFAGLADMLGELDLGGMLDSFFEPDDE